LYELLSGQLPFNASSPAESMMMRMHEPPIPPRTINDQLPNSLETVLLRALERDLEARYAEMEAFVSDLKRVLERLKRSSETSAQEPKTTPMITTRLGAPSAVQGPQLFIATSGVALSIPILDEVMVGRRDPLTTRLPDVDLDPFGGGSAGVSRQHARFLHRSDGWFLEDLQSTNGTYVNEVRLLPQRPVRVRSGDLVRFGQMTLVFEE
jgi:serine/threonine protein kinase